MSINMKLAEARGLDENTITAIESVHSLLVSVLNHPEKFDKPSEVVEVVESVEFTLQLLWGFPTNRNYHKWWNRVKGCSCPRMDNDDMIGSEYKIYNSGCPYHGAKNETNV